LKNFVLHLNINHFLIINITSKHSIFNADLALSVTMTAISTILSTAMLPLNVFIYSRLTYSSDVLDSLDWESLGISLLVVIIGISGGIFISYKFSESERGNKIRDYMNKLGNVSGLGLILFTSLAPEGGTISIVGREPIFYYGTIMPIVLGLLFSIIISTVTGLKKPERVTVSVECVYQNTSIAMTSCLALFSGDDQQKALGVPFWYTGMQTTFVGFYCLAAWQFGWTKAPRKHNIVKVLLNNYQDDDDSSDGSGSGTNDDPEEGGEESQTNQKWDFDNIMDENGNNILNSTSENKKKSRIQPFQNVQDL
jgi:hypothetical protein